MKTNLANSNLIDATDKFAEKRNNLSKQTASLNSIRAEIKNKIKVKIDCEMSVELIFNELKPYRQSLIDSGVVEVEDFIQICYSEVKEELKRKPSSIDRDDDGVKAHIKLLMKCNMIKNIEDNSEILFIDPKSGETHKYDINGVIEMLGKEFNTYKKEKQKLSIVHYNAFNSPILSKDKHDRDIYNKYQAPAWRINNFLKNAKIEDSEMPECYKVWFKNLVADHEESYEYILDWLATSLQGRNYTYLTMIGEEGIGKGVTGAILRALHGESNYRDTTGAVFRGQFNSELQNKTLVFVDEVNIKSPDDVNRVKSVANDRIRVERKGFDAEEVDNFASYVFASNYYDGVVIGDGDRRFSITELTDAKVQDNPVIKKLVDEDTLVNAANIELFARFLYNRKVTRNMMVPFKSSERAETVQMANLKDWQIELLEISFIAVWGKDTVTHEQIQERVLQLNNITVGRIKITDFFKRFPKRFKVTQPKPNHFSITRLNDPIDTIEF